MILYFFTISKSFEESVTSNFSKGPELIISSDEGIISEAITLFKPNSFLSSKTTDGAYAGGNSNVWGAGEWETIVIPINDMYASFRGRRLYMKNYDNTFFEELSILAGNKKNENFKLLINNIYLE